MSFVINNEADLHRAIDALNSLVSAYRRIYSVPYTARVLGISNEAVYNLIKSGSIKAGRLDDVPRSPYLVDSRSVHLYKQQKERKLAAKASKASKANSDSNNNPQGEANNTLKSDK